MEGIQSIILVSLFLLLNVITVNCRLNTTDPCNPVLFSKRPERNVDIPDDCSNGTVSWHYPMAFLNIFFTATVQEYEICIGHIADKAVRKIQEIIDGVIEELPLPAKGEEICTLPTTKNVTMRIVGPRKFTTYTAYIPYFIYDMS
ncbi:uncharacterized protein LOC134713902 [Mytilus trossulus]|uniref:uncharacterized protein LOC134713902 n=1 Tax=Mytilus trossulus TaxID=6551 RepID=UPI003007CB95